MKERAEGLIGTLAERHSSVVDSACDTYQNSPGSISPRAGFLSAALQSLRYKEIVLIYKVHLPFS